MLRPRGPERQRIESHPSLATQLRPDHPISRRAQVKVEWMSPKVRGVIDDVFLSHGNLLMKLLGAILITIVLLSGAWFYLDPNSSKFMIPLRPGQRCAVSGREQELLSGTESAQAEPFIQSCLQVDDPSLQRKAKAVLDFLNLTR
jgi:hypothetical protein